MKRIYLAGAVTGLPEDQVLRKFRNKTIELKAQGHIVSNPVDHITDHGLKDESWQDIMKVCICMLMNCDELHLLPCWQSSKGATLERDIALRLRMPIIYY